MSSINGLFNVVHRDHYDNKPRNGPNKIYLHGSIGDDNRDDVLWCEQILTVEEIWTLSSLALCGNVMGALG